MGETNAHNRWVQPTYYRLAPAVAARFVGLALIVLAVVMFVVTAVVALAGGDVTLVAVTGWGQDNDRASTLRAGFNHHRTKPVSFDKMEDILAEVRQQTQVA